MNDLMVQEREHLKVRAQTNKIIAENRLLVEDETMSYDDRIAALDKAIAAELNAVDARAQDGHASGPKYYANRRH